MIQPWIIILIISALVILIGIIFATTHIGKMRKAKKYERSLKMVPLLIHLPPSTDDIDGGGRDRRDVAAEAISKAQLMYSILASTTTKGMNAKLYGQRHFSFEIISSGGIIRYLAFVPLSLTEVVKQAIQSAYPTARIEERDEENIFTASATADNIAGAELTLNKEYYLPIATYEDTKRDASMAILTALGSVNKNEGAAVQILFRPADKKWASKAKEYVENTEKGKKSKTPGASIGQFAIDVMRAPWEPPEVQDKSEESNPVSSHTHSELDAINNQIRYPAFETLIRIVVCSDNKERSTALAGGIVSAFSQFDSPELNGFKVNFFKDMRNLARDYTFRFFPLKVRTNILNSVELASIFHLPEQDAIPNSSVERQLTKQVDGPAKLATDGIFLGTNEFRGNKKPIYLSDDDRRRHMYVIGQTGMGKSVFLENLAFQDMCDGRGFAFIDPHGDAVEALLQRVPEDRVDDIIYFDPADIEHPVGMNMFEYTSEDQKDFIVQEGISMLQSLFDPTNQGFFGPRGQHMFRNAALLLMADPKGATFIDIPQCFTDPEFVKSKLKYVTDKAVYDYWTKEFPASQKSSDAGEVITWFASKWGPFLSNTIMRNTLGQVKSGFNIREIMDHKKIFLVNLSKGRLGDINANLLGMIFVMKFQQAAMSRQDIPEHERQDFCLYVDEFQNFATDSFESILSEARKYRLNLIVANQFMTQLTDKIREALLGNVGTIICGRVGVTDADLMVKAFSPVFSAEDLTKTPNHAAVCKVMMFGMPSSPFTLNLAPPMGEPNEQLMNSLKVYSATKYAKTRAEVEREINERWSAAEKDKGDDGDALPSADAGGNNSGNASSNTGASAPAAAPRSEKGILDDWLAKNPTPAAKAPAAKPNAPAPSTPPTTAPRPTLSSTPAATPPAPRKPATPAISSTPPLRVPAPQPTTRPHNQAPAPQMATQPAAPVASQSTQPEEAVFRIR
ncbi:TraM recognition domain-containing protein [Candidatus Saccharibacteria bacterium]|nr:TraM recognition domain-containing protein [Candidatus Saccharibacteria bacterium]